MESAKWEITMHTLEVMTKHSRVMGRKPMWKLRKDILQQEQQQKYDWYTPD